MKDDVCEACPSVKKVGWEEPCVHCNGVGFGKEWGRKHRPLSLTMKPINLHDYDAPMKIPDDLVMESDNPFNNQVAGSHYKKEKGCPDVAEWCGMQKVEFLEGNVIKYVFRHERKNGLEDLEKAVHYLRFIAWVKYQKTIE